MCSCLCTDPDAWEEASAAVLTLGLQGSGKSVLLGQLAAYHARRAPLLQAPGVAAAVTPVAVPDTLPTTGTELWKLPPNKAGLLPQGLILREVGGQMQPIWHHYFDEVAAVLFVVDTAQPSTLADAAMVLFDLFQDQQLQGKPLCVLLNKRDVPGALSQSQLDTVLRLHDLRLSHPGRLQVLIASGLCGQGLSNIMKWLAAVAALEPRAADCPWEDDSFVLQTIRANPSFHGRPFYDSVAVWQAADDEQERAAAGSRKGANGRKRGGRRRGADLQPEMVAGYAKLLLLFSVDLPDRQGDLHNLQLAYVQWYHVVEEQDPLTQAGAVSLSWDMVQDPVRRDVTGRTPRCGIIHLSSIIRREYIVQDDGFAAARGRFHVSPFTYEGS